MKQKGFTLIEVVIALSIFAIIASLTAYILFHSFNTDKHLEAHSQQRHDLIFAITLLRRDTQQSIDRPVYGNHQSLIPAFIGASDLAEWTRSGFVNPDAKEHRSTLKRVAYLCQRGALIRRTWALLDTPDRRQYHDQVLLRDLKQCRFTYLNGQHQTLESWSKTKRKNKEGAIALPAAMLVSISSSIWGDLSLVLPLPVGNYA